jgi:hypothetical protein
VFTLPAFLITKGWIYIAFMVLGGAVGSKLLVLLTLKIGRNKREIVLPDSLQNRKSQRIVFYILSALFLISVIMAFLLPQSGQDKAGLILAMVLLTLFGFITERGTVCMSSMLKEWFISHSAYVWRSVLFTIMCLALFYQAGLQLDLYAPIAVDKVVFSPMAVSLAACGKQVRVISSMWLAHWV